MVRQTVRTGAMEDERAVWAVSDVAKDDTECWTGVVKNLRV